MLTLTWKYPHRFYFLLISITDISFHLLDFVTHFLLLALLRKPLSKGFSFYMPIKITILFQIGTKTNCPTSKIVESTNFPLLTMLSNREFVVYIKILYSLHTVISVSLLKIITGNKKIASDFKIFTDPRYFKRILNIYPYAFIPKLSIA